VRTMKVGLLVTVALALLMGAILTLGQQEHFWERKVRYEIHFARTNGLQVGAPVSLTGVVIGSVAEMRFPSDPAAAYIEVVIGVTRDVTARLRENSVATIRTYGLLGDRYIELTAGSPDAGPVPPGGLLYSIDPIDYEAVLGQSGDIVTNIVEVTASLKDVLGSIQRGEGLLGAMVRNRELGESTLVDLQHTMANVQETSRVLEKILRRVEHGQGLLGQLTGPNKEADTLLARVARTSHALERFATRLERGKGALPQLIEDEAYARRVLGNLDRTVADLADVAAKLDRGQGTLGKLVNDPSLYHEAEGLVGRVRRSWWLRLMGGSSAPAEPLTPSAPASEAPGGERGTPP
jgi:phospholipid/cholesterol/gamma-HCH transport system substrate-binding protein